MSQAIVRDGETIKSFFVTHIGTVTVNNFGAVQFEANAQTPIGLVVREGQSAKVICSVDTLKEIVRGVRDAVADMRKEGVYVR